ncbi:biotin--[acetyl-CoA-carboxylase] ligase [Caldimonas thermodepolymerans]|uniref:biotin--[acetyl-CoA-carboxylase] ligase n=1 Tax=Caldimonas thermodepolymerans TaxID=215580 RepID=UPI0022354B04|nr:biotin--[acetyl-CoA-carboxylase] ligase [Caldimonas thermodepolymerans]UZG44766.1 biotin--[acetyl-CoA-carboxylase] ligase [Caldimonas thermodepolymerans]
MTCLHWPAEQLWEQLSPLAPALSVEVVAQTGSTNTELLERARRGDTAPCLLVAEHQSAGRGRQGRSWQSLPGDSLTFSLGLPYAPASWSGLSLAVGVAVAEALHEQVKLKWPNDLWLLDDHGHGRKLGGILIETVPLPGGGRFAVIGIGLNVARAPETADARNAAAALRELDGQLSAPAALGRIALPLWQALQAFEREGFRPFAARYAARDLLRGRAVHTTQPDAPEGTAAGVDEEGALLVHTPAGTHRIESGEVSVRPC